MSRILYPKISNYSQQWLVVDEHHQLFIEQSGNPEGIPVLYLHGGPGAGSNAHSRRYFDPEKYRIILFDQRGCGRSIPSPSIKNNTTEHLIDDLEGIRQHLKIDKWLITGGSWGTTLGLLYGIKHPQHLLGFILRGIFLANTRDYQWLYASQGAARFFPDYYQEFINAIGGVGEIEGQVNEREVLNRYQSILTADNEIAAIAASKAWFLWELRLSSLEQQNINKTHIDDPHQAHCMALLSCCFFNNQSFIDNNYILEHIEKIAHLPATLIHGRYDMVCQPINAFELSRAWPNAALQILPQAGHSGFETQTIDAFCQATDNMAAYIQEQDKK